jgi:hypothetical protein
MLKNAVLGLIIFSLAVFSFGKFAKNKYWDLSQNKISSLSNDSKKLLSMLDSPLIIDIYSPSIGILNTASDLSKRYAKYSPQVKIDIHQTTLDPDLSVKLKVVSDHNMIINYKNQQQAMDIKIHELSEQKISSLIQKTLNAPNQWIIFLTGHQEADPYDTSLLGLSSFSKIFIDQGMHIGLLNLTEVQQIPSNTDTLIVANPQQDLSVLEKKLLHEYLARGGKLLWFTEPDSPATSFLTAEFKVQLAMGVAVDPESIKLGSPHPALKIVTVYPPHSISGEIKSAVILPWSGHLQINSQVNTQPNNWQINTFLTTGAQTWTYTGDTTFDLATLSQHKAQLGPLNIGLTFSRSIDDKHSAQHCMIIADSSFISNKYISLYANGELTRKMLVWLEDSNLSFVFSPTTAKDFSYKPNNLDLMLYQYGFTLLLPLLLICMGFYLQRR